MPTKYRSRACVIDGHRFQSLKEGARYRELKLLVKAGLISDLTLQPKIPLSTGGIKICTYIADFYYFDRKTANTVWEDVKGFKTPIYRLKKKLVKALCNIDITEI